ncbi:MAG: helix-turn-helix transcriptional regulator [Clostridia bacterium]|nr:helix-turn-helix transcriptional regulator [Clostridia bacterium]MBQ3463921.1 helix-turn-helix transcriptional regulator [Clostridia bacterium]
MKFAEKLRNRRKELNLSQADLAKKSGVSRRTIANYESGDSYPKSADTYARLAEALDVSEDSLKDENTDFIIESYDKHGRTARTQAEKLVGQLGALFAGGEMSDEDMDGVMRVMQEHFWKAKDENKKYTPKKYRK